MKKTLVTLISGIASGMFVGIGGAVYLSCENKTVGAALFAVALLTICMFSLYLFTGKIGYLATDLHFSTVYDLAVGLAGNVIGAYGTGILIKLCRPTLAARATEICSAKLEQEFYVTIILAAFCGVLMYTAVEIFKTKGSVLGIIYCIPVFILSGFEHSVADVFYFTVSDTSPAKWVIFIIFAVLGNAAGSIFTRIIHRISNIKI